MPAAKGTIPPNAGKGRKKGSVNKATATLKEMILAALDKNGGVNYLAEQAKTSPAAFMTLLGKVMPTQVTGDPNNPLVTAMRIEFV